MFLRPLVTLLLLFSAISTTLPALEKIRFILNPTSGKGDKSAIEQAIRKEIDRDLFEAEILYSLTAEQATELSREAAENGYGMVVAVGGDGTVNAIGKGLLHSKTALGIIPSGSGNGLAYHLQLPTDPVEAVAILNRGKTLEIDTVRANHDLFIGMAGIGFDAHVAKIFAQQSTRGLATYAWVVTKEFPFYLEPRFELSVDGKPLETNAFLISFANGSQYGNQFSIAPSADVTDGLLRVAIVEHPPFYALPKLLWQMTQGKIEESPYYHSLTCKELVVKQRDLLAHLDGDSVSFDEELQLTVLPHSLKVIIP